MLLQSLGGLLKGIFAERGVADWRRAWATVAEGGVKSGLRRVLFQGLRIREHYEAQAEDEWNRVYSIGQSWTRKVLSSVRVYAEQRDLPFFLYERFLAHKFFWAQVRAKRMGVTRDVMARDSQASAGYWEIVQDALADLVRVMQDRCWDGRAYPRLYWKCRSMRREVWLCAFPNLFITTAPAGWRFRVRISWMGSWAACTRGRILWHCVCIISSGRRGIS